MGQVTLNRRLTSLQSGDIEDACRDFPEFSGPLRLAYHYIPTDPESTCTKARYVLEQIVKQTYGQILHQPLQEQASLAALLADQRFRQLLPAETYRGMQEIRDSGNEGTHGKATQKQAVEALAQLLEVLDWWKVQSPVARYASADSATNAAMHESTHYARDATASARRSHRKGQRLSRRLRSVFVRGKGLTYVFYTWVLLSDIGVAWYAPQLDDTRPHGPADAIAIPLLLCAPGFLAALPANVVIVIILIILFALIKQAIA